MGAGTQDEDSAVTKLKNGVEKRMKALRIMQQTPVSTSVPLVVDSRTSPSPSPHHARRGPVPWLAIATFILPIATVLAALTWSGGGTAEAFASVSRDVSEMADKVEYLSTVSKDVSDMSIKVDELGSKERDIERSVGDLNSLVSQVLETTHAISNQLSELRGMQSDASIDAVMRDGRMDLMERELEILYDLAKGTEYTGGHTSAYVKVMKKQMSVLWKLQGLPPIDPPKGEKP